MYGFAESNILYTCIAGIGSLSRLCAKKNGDTIFAGNRALCHIMVNR